MIDPSSASGGLRMTKERKDYMYIKYEDIHAFKRLDLARIFESYGLKVTRHNGGFLTHCPFHEDTNASLSINKKRDIWLWHCFGCNKGGTAIDFVMRKESLSLPDAYTKLSKIKDSIDPSIGEETIAAEESVISDPKLISSVLDHYAATFKNTRKPQDYLIKDRGLSNREIYDYFQVGYSDGTLPKQKELIRSLKDAGILTASDREILYDSVIFPIEDLDGNILSLYGRRIDKKEHRYLKGPHRGVFNARAFRASSSIFITEAIIDALSLYQVGIREAVSLFGTGGLTDNHIKYMKETLTKEVILALDNDDAGISAASLIAARLKNELGLTCKKLSLPDGIKDINQWLLGGMTKDDVLKNIRDMEDGGTAAGTPIHPDGTGDIHFGLDSPKRSYRVRGLNLKDVSSLKCNLKIVTSSGSHLDTFDLASSMSRERFKKMAVKLLNLDEAVIHRDLAAIIERIEYIQSEELKKKENSFSVKPSEMTDIEKLEALSLLKDPRLLERIVEDYHSAGFVGEDTNLLMGYIAATSRKLDSPLSLLTISRSSAGKTSLQDAILSFMPEEDVIKYTRLTDQSLFYHEEESLYKKALAIEEEEGARGAGYAIRNLLTSKYLKTSTTIKDPESGKLRSQSTSVKVQTLVFLTTTSHTLDHETLSRFIIATVDESEDQTRKILEYQRKLYGEAGHALKKTKNSLKRLHSNAQRLLADIDIVNPYQDSLTFTVKNLRARREQIKYLTLINVITYLRQYQKPIRSRPDGSRFIEVDSLDIEAANKFAKIYIRRNLDYLSPQARALYGHIKKLVRSTPSGGASDPQVSRREIIEYTGWGEWQVRTHIEELINLEYISIAQGGVGKRYRYTLVDEIGYDIPQADIDIKEIKDPIESIFKANLEEPCGAKTTRF